MPRKGQKLTEEHKKKMQAGRRAKAALRKQSSAAKKVPRAMSKKSDQMVIYKEPPKEGVYRPHDQFSIDICVDSILHMFRLFRKHLRSGYDDGSISHYQFFVCKSNMLDLLSAAKNFRHITELDRKRFEREEKRVQNIKTR